MEDSQSFVLHTEPYGVEQKSSMKYGEFFNMRMNYNKRPEHKCWCEMLESPYKSAPMVENGGISIIRS